MMRSIAVRKKFGFIVMLKKKNHIQNMNKSLKKNVGIPLWCRDTNRLTCFYTEILNFTAEI